MKVPYFGLVLASALLGTSSAQESGPAIDFDFYWNGEADLEDTPAGSMKRQELTLSAPIWGTTHGEWTFGSGLRYRLDLLEFEDLGGLDDLTLHRIDFPFLLGYTPENSRWSGIFRLSPGVATDFSSLSGDDFTFSAILAADYQWTDDFTLTGGVYYTPDIAGGAVLPSLGFKWTPDENWYFRLAMPSSEIRFQPREDVAFKIAAYSAGGSWNVDEYGDSVDLDLRTIRVGIGIEKRVGDHFWWSLWAGTNLLQKLEVEEAGGGFDYLETDVENSAFFQLGFKYEF